MRTMDRATKELLQECRRANEDKLRKELPEHAERIIAERNTVYEWEIQLMVKVHPNLMFTSPMKPEHVKYFKGDEYEALAHVFELKRSRGPYQNRNFRAVRVV